MRFSSGLFASWLATSVALVAAQSEPAPAVPVRKSGTPLSVSTVKAAAAQATIPITISGNTFMRGSDRFFFLGMDWQPGGSSQLTDPLSDKTVCERDIAIMQDLGVNTVRVYSVDNSANHDDCMQLMQKAGMYLVLDANTPLNSLNRQDAASSYNAAYLQHLFATVDAFKKYPNVIGFFAGNEVVNDGPTVGTSPWIKAVVRDMKNYIKAQSSRAIFVGYSSTDVPDSRYLLPEYLTCGDNSTRADFIGTNVYSWCGDSSYTLSGYDKLVAGFSNLTVPIFFSEYGCNLVTDQSKGRPFTEVEALYSSQMTGVFSGGLVYELTQADNNYGVIQTSASGAVEALPDYANLKAQFAAVKLDGKTPGTTNTKAPTCPRNMTSFSGIWVEDVLPAVPAGALAYFKNGAGKALGNGEGSTQNAGSGTGNQQQVSSVAVSSSMGLSASTGAASMASARASGSATARSAAVAPALPRSATLWIGLAVASCFFMLTGAALTA